MPTRKPIIQIVLSETYTNKLRKLAEKEDKSNSKFGAKIIERYIDDYEKENGTIETQKASATNYKCGAVVIKLEMLTTAFPIPGLLQ